MILLLAAVCVALLAPTGPAPRAVRPPGRLLHGRLVSWIRVRVEPRLPSLSRIRDGEILVVLLLSAAMSPLAPPVAVAGPLGLAAEAVRRARAQAQRHERTLIRLLPELLDQLGLVVAAGMSMPDGLRSVARWLPREVATLVEEALGRLDAGAALADALGALATSLPPSCRGPVAVIVAASRDGAPLGPGLARAAAEARRAHRRAAEARARRLPVLMLLPLVLCVLPAFVLLTLVPLVIGSLDGLRLPG